MTASLRSSLFPVVSLGLVGVLAGCGDDGDDECVAVEACGGDITGQWTLENFCGQGSFPITGCDEPATLDLGGVEVTGTLTFDADGTYTSVVSSDGDALFIVPSACLPDGATCDDLEDETTSCTASGGGCQCTSPFTDDEGPSEETGTWETSGNMLTFGQEGDEASIGTYCVDGDVLTLNGEAGDEQTSIEFTYVLNRN